MQNKYHSLNETHIIIHDFVQVFVLEFLNRFPYLYHLCKRNGLSFLLEKSSFCNFPIFKDYYHAYVAWYFPLFFFYAMKVMKKYERVSYMFYRLLHHKNQTWWSKLKRIFHLIVKQLKLYMDRNEIVLCNLLIL